ncbi:hypothetical protein SAMN04487857_103188 [Pseudomonas sp. ok272]|uniref:hypothetical protein n=1 Tax=unclassified Pseudomonas TaxID=196821 RepID=UPI0008D1FB5E|nr:MULTISPECIES: hypothetical protein [unclassified Pseudomonas]SEM61064.1 hypothetical protein SAMN04487857_103188 [Pseudomonas sp. ok272]SFM49253.1 hypothetical protein SAMN04487858_103247 [Pseudomonas sp. ok602]
MNSTLKTLFSITSAALINFGAFTSNAHSALIDDPLDPIRIFAIIHDDVPTAKRTSLYTEYLQPFISEFENITGRKAHVFIDQDRPPYTHFNYKNEDPAKSLEQWVNLAWEYAKERHNTGFLESLNSRYILITNDFINGGPVFGGTGGFARRPGAAAIASLDFKQTVGHELGHTFNAVHEEGEVLYNGWWCETFMFPPLPLRSNCLVFSDGNRKRIKDYVDSRY